MIYGAGGYGREVLDIFNASRVHGYDCAVFVDDGDLSPGTLINGAPFLGGWEAMLQLDPATTSVGIGVGNPKYRAILASKIRAAGYSLATLIDPMATVRPSAEIGEGVIIGAGAFVSCNARIDGNVLLNLSCLIGHDAVVGAHAVISPFAVLLGGAKVGVGSELGGSCQIFPRTNVGDWARVAMSAAVFKDVPANTTVSGNPARVVSQREAGWQLE